jgi:translation initiation factor IF-2
VAELLQKKGKALEDVTPNAKLTDEQYDLLLEAYGADKAEAKKTQDAIAQRKSERPQKPAKPEKAPRADMPKTDDEQQPQAQKFTVLGKIDLDSVGKPAPRKEEPAAPASTPEAHQPAAATHAATDNKAASDAAPAAQRTEDAHAAHADKAASAAAQATTQAAPTAAASTSEPQAEEARPATPSADTTAPTASAAPAAASTPAAEASVADGSHAAAASDNATAPAAQHEAPASTAADEASQPGTDAKGRQPIGAVSQDGVFRMQPRDAGVKFNVVGKIDLDALNSKTRPDKKKKNGAGNRGPNGQGGTGENAGGEGKKKRNRIGKERVDINAAANQQQNGGANRGGQQGGNPRGHSNANAQQGQQQARGKKNKKNAPVKPVELTDEEIAKQVKETLARLTSKQMKKGVKYRKDKREAIHNRMAEEAAEEHAESKVLKLTEYVTANELATMMDISVNQVIGTCMSIGIMVSINQRLDAETINLVAEEFGFTTSYVSEEVSNAVEEAADAEEDLVPRAPIITVMGHVDHGKTSLLDYIRKTNVIAGEAGGITQHIGAYNVKMQNGKHITFLDTPGHEAFTAMRARGAKVTDIAIIIIAADDSIMPQTREAISHCEAANVPMVFAINKIDKPGANPEKIKEELAAMNYLVEDWGGKYQSQEIAAKHGVNVDALMEKVLLEAEMLDLRANPDRKATGSVIESSLDKGRGYVATVLVQNGTLHQGDIVLAGTHYGRVRAMFNERGQRIQQALPAEPAVVLGLNGAPTAGDTFHTFETEQEAREIANKREQLKREQGLRTTRRKGLEDIAHDIALGGVQDLNLIVKGDVDGSIEALSDSLIKLSTEKIRVNVIHKAVGQISESDVELAHASEAIIIGFQVRPSQAARRLADTEGVDIRLYSIIYDTIEEVKSAMEGMLAPEIKEEYSGTAEVRQVYKITKVGTVAGAFVTDGKIHRSDKIRVIREGIVVHTADIKALKRFKDDVKEVTTNFDCGISLVNYNDIREGDVLEAFTEVEVKQKL